MLNYILKSLIIIFSLVFLIKIYLKIFKIYQLNGYQLIKTLNFIILLLMCYNDEGGYI